jgi:hypothetical protein
LKEIIWSIQLLFLGKIAGICTRTQRDYDSIGFAAYAIESHRETMMQRKTRLEAIFSNVEAIIQAHKEGIPMDKD